MVVIKGPVARAGSSFNLVEARGMKVPNRDAKNNDHKKGKAYGKCQCQVSAVRKLYMKINPAKYGYRS